MKFINGEVNMTAVQVRAALSLINKVIPDVKAIEIKGSIDINDARELTRTQLLNIASGSSEGTDQETGRVIDVDPVH